VNYYERHLGDYARDAAHLSLLEHGVYTLLLDRYYATEQGIPAAQAHRVARARSADELAAVDAVLDEFFVLADGVWTNGRVEEELAKARVRIEAARENGKKGGRKPKQNPAETHREPAGFDPPNRNGTQEKAPQAPPNHLTTKEQSKDLVQPAAPRSPFERFWREYPNKQGKQAAEKTWQKRKLDALCDDLLLHVALMQAADDGWRRGFIPMGSTYLNQARWEDVPKRPPDSGPPAKPASQTRSAAETLLTGTSHAQRLDQRHDSPRLGEVVEHQAQRLPAGRHD